MHYCLGLLLFLLGLDLGNPLLVLGLQCFDKVNGAHNRVHCILILHNDLDVLPLFASFFCLIAIHALGRLQHHRRIVILSCILLLHLQERSGLLGA